MRLKKRYIFLGIFLALVGLGLFPGIVQVVERINIYSADESIEPAPVALVFGAGLNSEGRPSDALADRLITAATLYLNGTVEEILVSGDNLSDSENYNEPEAMTAFLIKWGVPENVIMQDYAGARTYDSCLRAKELYNIEDAILITQEFHLPRALFTCNALGVDSIGVIADRQPYVKADYYDQREWFATYKALLDLYIWTPDTVKEQMDIL